MKKRNIFNCLILVVCLGMTACTLEQEKLIGQWQAVAFYENGKTLTVALDSVALHINENEGYEFRGQGKYQELGTYRLAANYLFLTDTSVRPVQEHTLKILFLSTDSLKIEMKKENKAQVLFFERRN